MLKGLLQKKRTGKLISLLMCLVMASSLLPMSALGAGETGDLTTVQPVLAVTGAGITGGTYTSVNISNEKSYTLAELQALGDGIVDNRVYSANSNTPGRRIYRGVGVDVAGLLELSGYTGAGTISAISPGTSGMTTSIDLSVPRYYYPDFADNANSRPITAMLAWQSGTFNQVIYDSVNNVWPGIPAAPGEYAELNAVDSNSLRLMVGQTAPDQVTTNLFNSGVNKLLVGAAITEKPITIDGTAYTRADLLMMPRAERSYTYNGSNGSTTDTVRGVPLNTLLAGIADSAVIEFTAADGYTMPSNMTGLTKG